MAKHAVVRTDKMMGTDVRSYVASVKYMGTGNTATAIDNGCIVKVNGLLETGVTGVLEREIYKAVTPAANDTIETLGLVCSPEVMYDVTKRDLADFYNEAGDIARIYFLHTGDIFSVTAEALDGTATVGKIVEVQAGTKMKVVTTATSGSTTIGKIIEVAPAGKYTFYAIQVA